MPRPRKHRVFLALIAALWVACSLHAGEAPSPAINSPLRLAMPETVALGADDTLELTLQTPRGSSDGTASPPVVNIFMLQNGAAPGTEAPSGRTLVYPSPRPGEWLVHVRGLKSPDGKPGLCDLLARWTFPQGGAKSSGEFRLARAVDFKAEAADVVLLMDGSLSLGRSDPQRLRVDAAREFIATARQTGSIGRIGIVQFDNNSRTLSTLAPLNSNFEQALEKLDERGQTDIDGGIRHALKLLQSGQQNSSTAAGASIILFTDGQQEPGVYGNAHTEATKAGVAVHTLALGREADRTLLRRIAAETGGTFADAAKDKDLALAYAAIASRIARARTILSSSIPADGNVAIPVDGACRSLAVSIGGEHAGVLSISNPNALNWLSPAQLHPEYFVEKPEAGIWSARFPSANGASVTASARTAFYPVIFRSDPQTRAPHELDTDEPTVAISLCENDQPIANATVQATLTLGEGNAARTLSAQLFDDGQHNDGAAGDGIYAAWLPALPDGTGAYPENANGTLKIIATGTREGAAFRRETETGILTKRHDGPALITSGALDLGTHFAGEDFGGEISLRVRGSGGALAIKAVPTSGGAGLSDLLPTFENVPAAMKARERLTQKFRVALPELLIPGEYGGSFELQLAGAELVRVPWRVRVAQPVLIAPESIDLGTLQPGDKAPLQLALKTSGGKLTVCSAELSPTTIGLRPLSKVAGTLLSPGDGLGLQELTPLLLRPIYPLQITRRTPQLLSCSSVSTDLDLDFDLAADAPAGRVQRWLLLRDFSCREIARVRVSAFVQPHSLSIDAPLALGAIEPGDSATRALSWSWQRSGLKQPLGAQVKFLPDARTTSPAPVLSAAQLVDGRPTARFELSIPREAQAGESGGWISIEAGPVLTLRRWSATIVSPKLTVDATALDFGKLIQGQRRTLKLTLHAEGARENTVTLSAPPAFPKLRLPHITLPPDALKITPAEITLAPNTASTLAVELTIPDSAQDGLYSAPLTLTSRLGTLTIPASITVINEIDPAAFHVTPITLPLRFDIRAKLPSESVRIISHRDDNIALNLELKPIPSLDGGPPAYKMPACFIVADLSAGDESHQAMTLPGRETLEVFVQARPDAQAGERCRLHISGSGEEQVVEILIERNAPPQLSVAPTETPRILNWLIFLLIGLTFIAAFIVHRLVKRAWVRYAFYSLLFHLAFLPWAMPRQTLLDALPDTVQISLLESEDSLGGALSEQQMRRLEALKTGGEGEEKITLATGDGVGGAKTSEKLPDLAAKDIARSAAPGASTLDSAHAAEAHADVAGGPTLRAPASPGSDAPLSSEALTPNPLAAAAPTPMPERVAARSVNPSPNAEPLPATLAAPEPRAAAPAADSALPAALANAPREVRTVSAADAAPRIIDDQPAADAPLEVAALSPDAKPAPASAAPISNPIARNAPASAPGTAGATRLSIPLPAASGVALGGGANQASRARSEDLARNTEIPETPNPGAPGGGDSASAKTSAGGVGAGEIDDPLDAGVLLGGASANGKGDAPTGGKASAAAGTGFGGKDANSARGGTALGALGAGNGGGELAFAAGIGERNGAGSGAGSGRGVGSTLPGFSVGTDAGGGNLGAAGGGNGSGRKPGGAGSGGDDDAPLSAGPIAGGTGGVGNGTAVSAKPGLPGGTSEGAGQIARGGSALRNGFSAGGTGTELALAGTQSHDGAPGIGGGSASNLARSGGGDAQTGTGVSPPPVGAAHRIGGTGTGGDGDAPLSAGLVVGGIGEGGTGAGATKKGSPGGITGGTGETLARGGTALGSGIAPGGTGTLLALAGPEQRGVPGGGGGSIKDLPHVGMGSPTGSGIGGGNGTASRPTAGTGVAETDSPLIADQIGNGKAPAGNGLGEAKFGEKAGQPGRSVAAGGSLGLGGGFGRGNGGGSLAGIPNGLGNGLGGVGGAIPGSSRGPNRKPGAELNEGLTSQQLEDQAGGGKMKGLREGSLPSWRIVGEPHTGGLIRLNIGVAKHSGDWDSSPTALHYLRAAFIERSGLPELEVNVLNALSLGDVKQLLRCRMIMITSNKPIVFTQAELRGMGEYVRAGGTLWVNDSSASDFEGFDQGFRPIVPQIIPGGELFSLPLDHPYFISCYDLSKGYKGFRVPPGDKYRQDYIEGVMVPDEQAAAKGIQAQRAGIIYTRNDYADGLEIDTRMNAGMKSLTDLTNGEMQEASLRFGMNLLAYSMGSSAPKLPPPPESTAQFEKLYRYNGPPLTPLDNFTVEKDQYAKPIWNAEANWCNDTQIAVLDDLVEKSRLLSMKFSGGAKYKAAAARNVETDLSNTDALVFDLFSDLKSGCNIALLFNSKDGKAYECRPVFARPGWNRGLRFPLGLGDMKSGASKEPWKEYDTALEPRNLISRITLLVYNLNESGSVKVGPIRMERKK